MKPRLGLTIGDIAGIGPELIEAALANEEMLRLASFTVYGEASEPRTLARRGRIAASAIRAATADALAGKIDGIVTAPLNKAALHAAGENFPGHTEMLAHLSGVNPENVRMFFWSPKLAVGLVTIHVALAEVPRLITKKSVLETIQAVAAAMPGRTIRVLGLNPHAGEGGLFGKEEIEAIEPAIRAAREEGIDAIGPLVPDVAFRLDAEGTFVAMYHDQGLIPFKMSAFNSGVNQTLGLPFVRTSPDHGTAEDIAGTGAADPSSFFAAIRRAVMSLEEKSAASKNL